MAILIDDRTAKTSKQVMDPNPRGYQWGMITLHHDGSKGTSDQAEENTIWYLSQPHADPVSCHKYIRRRKGIVKIVPENWISWCNGRSRHKGKDDTNVRSLTYEIANTGLGTEAYTDLQYEWVALSVAYDCARYRINDSDVVSHRRVRNAWVEAHPIQARLKGVKLNEKSDPRAWDWRRMWKRIDEIRANWPVEFAQSGVPCWFNNDGRQLVT
jgi:N-acetyl-anhydromuramyl-L-alanine amidase AmpD